MATSTPTPDDPGAGCDGPLNCTCEASTVPTAANRGLLPVGTRLPDGAVIADVSLTAYRIAEGVGARPDCVWRSFDQVHGRPAAASPLVVLR